MKILRFIDPCGNGAARLKLLAAGVCEMKPMLIFNVASRRVFSVDRVLLRHWKLLCLLSSSQYHFPPTKQHFPLLTFRRRAAGRAPT